MWLERPAAHCSSQPAASSVQTCQLSFEPNRLLPMGSYPRVADKHATHDLYGPVNRFVCTGYDRAQVAFLACLKVLWPRSPSSMRCKAVVPSDNCSPTGDSRPVYASFQRLLEHREDDESHNIYSYSNHALTGRTLQHLRGHATLRRSARRPLSCHMQSMATVSVA
jgi:hypothetical protein